MPAPHLLFEYAKYQTTQTAFLDLFIPELRLQHANLNNLRQFDDLFYHIESTFGRNNEFAETNTYAHLKVPSVALFGVIFTLSARSSAINWTNNSNLLDGISASNESMNSGSDAYNNCIYKLPLSERALRLLRRYVAIFHEIGPQNIKGLLPATTLYENLTKSLREFIVKQPNPRDVLTTETPRKVSRLTGILVIESASEDQSRATTPEMGPSPTPADNREIVSDSEDNGDLLNEAMVGELYKFQTYNFSPAKDSSSSHLGKTLFDGMPHLLRPQSRDTSEESDAHETPKEKDTGVLKVFDDFLITQKLNPSSLPSYSLWSLLQWAFYCADESSKYQRHLFNSSNTSYSKIYRTYKHFIDVVMDLVAVNLAYKVAKIIKRRKKSFRSDSDASITQTNEGQMAIEQYFSGDEKARKAITKAISSSSDVLLLSLMSQLASSKRYWYDRVVEYVFTGLKLKSNYTPYPCYERERLLIKHDALLHLKGYSSEEKYDDNNDSMELRFKILALVYYRSLFFANGDDFQHALRLNDSTPPKLLVSQICGKLFEVEYKFLVGFYEASEGEANVPIPGVYRDSMMHSVSRSLIAEITKLVEIDDFLYFMDDKNKLQTALDLIQNDDIFLSLTEDVTYKSWDAFYDDWLKLNFLAAWMLEFALDGAPEASKLNKEVLAIARAVDAKKEAHYRAFVVAHSVKNSEYNFSLGPADRERLLGIKGEWVSFAEVVEFKGL